MFLRFAMIIALGLGTIEASQNDNDKDAQAQSDAYDRRDISCRTKTPSPPNTPRK